uniref:Uncharacterized protein n=1 Tax=Anguilla anguilla TaxID=7936 RepID=A0A0E9RIK2_ANGAN
MFGLSFGRYVSTITCKIKDKKHTQMSADPQIF